MIEDKIIIIKNLSKYFLLNNKIKWVIKDINMEIKEGEFIVILGPGGCGKSTFLKILCGIENQSSGTIILKGRKFEKNKSHDIYKKFGFVFQNSNLLPWRTAEKNLSIVLEIQKLESQKWKSRIDEMLDIVGLSAYKKMFPHELSGGMQQRLSIARALVNNPKILLMDQPLGSLDAITRKILGLELLKIWEKTKKTIIMVTNNVDEAILLGTRIFVFTSLPANIKDEVEVNIPFEEKDSNIISNKRYNEIHKYLSRVIRSI
ncbi:MAG: hypothetical protein A2Z35_02730 [Actinobacteria bacterium RBG_19FT_COMBO_36_27]|nr:MAG: hypothetical protein A2Z35_02730 [Actinobacteria bacterium RBG_19FT_COMBO_36_27]